MVATVLHVVLPPGEIYKGDQKMTNLYRLHLHKIPISLSLSLSHSHTPINLISDEGLRSPVCAFGARRLGLVFIALLCYQLTFVSQLPL